uniref:Immunoglobulin I-set domain-containing protein n=1 Tax=Plectus sambesii TaxID=2011161 RepID=A0A914WJD7_9BILA
MVFEDGICILRLNNAEQTDEAEYTCQAINAVGQASTTCRLTMKPAQSKAEETVIAVDLVKERQANSIECTVLIESKDHSTKLVSSAETAVTELQAELSLPLAQLELSATLLELGHQKDSASLTIIPAVSEVEISTSIQCCEQTLGAMCSARLTQVNKAALDVKAKTEIRMQIEGEVLSSESVLRKQQIVSEKQSAAIALEIPERVEEKQKTLAEASTVQVEEKQQIPTEETTVHVEEVSVTKSAEEAVASDLAIVLEHADAQGRADVTVLEAVAEEITAATDSSVAKKIEDSTSECGFEFARKHQEEQLTCVLQALIQERSALNVYSPHTEVSEVSSDAYKEAETLAIEALLLEFGFVSEKVAHSVAAFKKVELAEETTTEHDLDRVATEQTSTSTVATKTAAEAAMTLALSEEQATADISLTSHASKEDIEVQILDVALESTLFYVSSATSIAIMEEFDVAKAPLAVATEVSISEKVFTKDSAVLAISVVPEAIQLEIQLQQKDESEQLQTTMPVGAKEANEAALIAQTTVDSATDVELSAEKREESRTLLIDEITSEELRHEVLEGIVESTERDVQIDKAPQIGAADAAVVVPGSIADQSMLTADSQAQSALTKSQELTFALVGTSKSEETDGVIEVAQRQAAEISQSVTIETVETKETIVESEQTTEEGAVNIEYRQEMTDSQVTLTKSITETEALSIEIPEERFTLDVSFSKRYSTEEFVYYHGPSSADTSQASPSLASVSESVAESLTMDIVFDRNRTMSESAITFELLPDSDMQHSISDVDIQQINAEFERLNAEIEQLVCVESCELDDVVEKIEERSEIDVTVLIATTEEASQWILGAKSKIIEQSFHLINAPLSESDTATFYELVVVWAKVDAHISIIKDELSTIEEEANISTAEAAFVNEETVDLDVEIDHKPQIADCKVTILAPATNEQQAPARSMAVQHEEPVAKPTEKIVDITLEKVIEKVQTAVETIDVTVQVTAEERSSLVVSKKAYEECVMDCNISSPHQQEVTETVVVEKQRTMEKAMHQLSAQKIVIEGEKTEASFKLGLGRARAEEAEELTIERKLPEEGVAEISTDVELMQLAEEDVLLAVLLGEDQEQAELSIAGAKKQMPKEKEEAFTETSADVELMQLADEDVLLAELLGEDQEHVQLNITGIKQKVSEKEASVETTADVELMQLAEEDVLLAELLGEDQEQAELRIVGVKKQAPEEKEEALTETSTDVELMQLAEEDVLLAELLGEDQEH